GTAAVHCPILRIIRIFDYLIGPRSLLDQINRVLLYLQGEKIANELSEKYGSIFTIYLGSEQVVVLYGHEILKEALISLGEEFSGRGSMPLFDKHAKET
ncbi:unnamed protein product, partial [Natator depressus]